ncbi:sugar phosphate isomerase/epimerase [Providencia stuartii]|uniref:sugar phosphate isomerase/epimerase family protein n=1 Tax=Providencia TaxID=586 RepID=UPI002941503C|nr:sugar phosphate isomerase/epimerase family protein [Providencia sp. 2023EL-00965]ELR5298316.1 sugar phosphate isomerase/epimerase [Providencia stuartii]MDW7586762.1 sugar phosphate isomerase/epimerase family protein [Providencia sp. 2023EL-00965]
MKRIQGPGLFLAQFIGDSAPFNSLDGLAKWASELGFTNIQIPTMDPQIFDLDLAATSQSYCDETVARLQQYGIRISELSTHIQGQLIAVHPAYDSVFDGFAPELVRGNPKLRQTWATEQLMKAAEASQRLGLTTHVTFSGALAWPYFYPWPPHNALLFEEAFEQLAQRWLPILNRFDECGIDVCYELHPGEDLHDGVTFERFLGLVNNHPRCHILYDPSHLHLQQMDYLGFIDCYHQRIRAFHVKDAEYTPSAKSGVYGGYQPWLARAGRFRSLGDGQIDFKSIFSKLTQYDFSGVATLEWECCLKSPEAGAREGAEFIQRHIIPIAEHAFDDFAAVETDPQQIRALLGIKGADV